MFHVRNAALKYPFDPMATSLWRLEVRVQQVRVYNELGVALLKGEQKGFGVEACHSRFNQKSTAHRRMK